MSEKEIRATIRALCAQWDLQAHVRKAGKGAREAVVPIIMGASLATTACGGKTVVDPPPNTSTASGSGGSSGGAGGTDQSGGSGGTGGIGA